MNITLSNPVISRLANDYVMSFLHYTGENTAQHISNQQEIDIRFYHADGFGNLSEKTNDTDSESLKDMLFDWSHVRDSSDEAFLAMAHAISACVSCEAKSEFNKASQKVIGDLRVLSLSNSELNPLLWSHYADSHRGFCLGFDPMYIDGWIPPQLRPTKVNYSGSFGNPLR